MRVFVKYEMNLWLTACLKCMQKFSLNWGHLWHKSTKLGGAKELFTMVGILSNS